MLDLGPWVMTGRMRASARIGLPWFGGFLAWVLCARATVGHPSLRQPGLVAWAAWLLVGGALLPAVVAGVSRLIDVPFRAGALAWASLGSLVATAAALLVLLPDFASFAVLGGFGVPLAAAVIYAVATSRGLEAWRDASGL